MTAGTDSGLLRPAGAFVACLLAWSCAGRGPADVQPPAAGTAALAGIETGWTPADCRADAEPGPTPGSGEGLDGPAPSDLDLDLDGLADECELVLARTFAPLLVVDPLACGPAADPGAPPTGAFLFGARPLPGAGVRLAYLPAYARDCGWSGPKCVLVGGACEGHTGDSEVIGIDVRPGSGDAWAVTAIFLSAHCFRDPGCRWYAGDDLDAFGWFADRPGGAPVIWVAAGTNANYPGRSACDRGHHFLDSCDRNDSEVRFPIVDGRQNVGSRTRPFMGRAPSGCLDAASAMPSNGEPGTDPEAEECFWSDTPFRGWIRPSGGTPPTPYVVYLVEILGF